MKKPYLLQEVKEESLKSYVAGLLLSVLLTGAAYLVVTKKLLTGNVLILTLIGLGVMQAFIQVLLFLQLEKESKPHWKWISFFFMILVAVILVFGSLWIMANLNYNMAS